MMLIIEDLLTPTHCRRPRKWLNIFKGIVVQRIIVSRLLELSVLPLDVWAGRQLSLTF